MEVISLQKPHRNNKLDLDTQFKTTRVIDAKFVM